MVTDSPGARTPDHMRRLFRREAAGIVGEYGSLPGGVGAFTTWWFAAICFVHYAARSMKRALPVAIVVVLCSLGTGADAATLAWKGHTWQLTSGGMAGVCQGDPKNVTVDANDVLAPPDLRAARPAGQPPSCSRPIASVSGRTSGRSTVRSTATTRTSSSGSSRMDRPPGSAATAPTSSTSSTRAGARRADPTATGPTTRLRERRSGSSATRSRSGRRPSRRRASSGRAPASSALCWAGCNRSTGRRGSSRAGRMRLQTRPSTFPSRRFRWE